MTAPWIISTVLQWCVIAVLAVLVASLVRQLGILSVRLNPSVGLAMDEGPGPGSELAAQEVRLMDGNVYLFGGAREDPLLTVFLSPDCTICNSVTRYVRTVADQYRSGGLQVLVVIHGAPRVVREFVNTYELQHLPVALRQDFPNNHNIVSTPFALMLSTEGTVVARGVPNALEHLEEMVERANKPAGDASDDSDAQFALAVDLTNGSNGHPAVAASTEVIQ